MKTSRNLLVNLFNLFFFVGLLFSVTNAQLNLQNETAGLSGPAQKDETIKVIIGLRLDDYRSDAEISAESQARQRFEISQKQISLLNRLDNFKLSNAKRFRYIPFLAMEVSPEALAALRQAPEVVSIQEDIEQKTAILQSVPLIGAPNAWTAGFTGQGRAVAILDTGVDKTHPFFNNRVVSEACYSTTSGTTTSFCPGGASQSTAADSGLPCNSSQLQNCFHGTHIAGIAAGGNPQITGAGVARNANIIAIQVFSRSTSCGASPSPCLTAFASDVILGLERVYELRSTFAIDAVNLSIAGGRNFGYCDAGQAAYKTAIDTLRSAGIATVVAAGNDGYTDSLSAPACVSSAISVGSTTDGSNDNPVDRVSSFSNSSPFLSLLAPGEVIISSEPGASYIDAQGTSQAAAHVTGAYAVIKQKFPNDSVAQIFNRLRNSGVAIFDSRNFVTKPRIKIDTALNAPNTPNAPNAARQFDFDGDGRADLSVFRPSDSVWFINPSSAAGTNGFNGVNFGLATDKLAPADYDGDGKTDIAVWRDEPSNPNKANFYILQSSNNVFRVEQFGRTGDTPSLVADWDGDGKADPAVYRNGTGGGQSFFFYRPSSQPTADFVTIYWGNAGDVPMRGDYDGDGRADAAVFRPSDRNWYILQSSNAQLHYDSWGLATDKFVPADYDGDGKTDLAVFRAGVWYIKQSANNTPRYVNFGSESDTLVPADYDGDSKTDIAVKRGGTWFLSRSQQGFGAAQFGTGADKPVQSAFTP